MIDAIAIGFGSQELLIVVVIVLVLFGGSKIPELMRGLGSGMREFKKGLSEEEEKSPATKKDPGAEK